MPIGAGLCAMKGVHVCWSHLSSSSAVYGEVVAQLLDTAGITERLWATLRELVHRSGVGGDGV
jgi:hypothetical protein